MAINKIIFGNETLIDLTSDTVSPDKILTGFTAHDKSGQIITGLCSFDVDSSDATASVGEVLNAKTFYASGSKKTGTMPNRGKVEGSINKADTPYNIPSGFHDGSGTVSVDLEEKSKLIPVNIRQGISVLGVVGTMTGLEDVKAQVKTVTPSIESQKVVPDNDYNYLAEVNINAIAYSETENTAGGITVTIAG